MLLKTLRVAVISHFAPKDSRHWFLKSFDFSVSQKPVRCHSFLHVKYVTHALYEHGFELRSLICVIRVWPAVPLEPLSHERSEDSLSRLVRNRRSLCSFRKTLDYRKYCLISTAPWVRLLSSNYVSVLHLELRNHRQFLVRSRQTGPAAILHRKTSTQASLVLCCASS